MKKKILSVLLAGALLGSMSVAGMVAVSAEEDTGLVPGSYSNHPTYTPTVSEVPIKTQHLMFAMPGAWMNETWEKTPGGGSAGLYWWTGYDHCKNQGWDNDWPGYKANKVTEEGVDNMWAIDVPTYGNGEKGNATQIIWNNFIDGGTIKDDDTKNPFYKAAQQSKDAPGQYYSRSDKNAKYEDLFRYIYIQNLTKVGVAGVDALDAKSDKFWEDINKLAAAHLGVEWDSLKADEKTYQIDVIMDEVEADFSEFGSYATNFFNEDLGEDPEVPNMTGLSFHFDNMVYVIDMDPNHISISPLSGKPGFDGDFYFYYGAGEYGTWPTKELNEKNGGISGNVMSEEYRHGKMPDITVPETTGSTSSTAGTASTDATSSKSSSTTGSATNTSNGAIATGQTSLVTIALIILVAGIGVVVFTRKKSQK